MILPEAALAQASAVCQQIQAQIARLDTAPSGGAASRRYGAAAGRQRAEIATATRQYQAMNCGGLFQGPQCSALSQHIGRMRANLAQLEADAGGGGVQSAQRAQARARLVAAYDANGCRGGGARQAAAPVRQGGGFWNDEPPERQVYRRAATPDVPQTAYREPSSGFGGFIERLFGVQRGPQPDARFAEPPADEAPREPELNADGENRPRGVGYRAVCVRLCDGAFFPMTSSARPGADVDEEEMCEMQCPGTEVALYRMRDDRIENAVSATGRPYTALPNALRFRQRFDAACTCRPANGSWAEAFANRTDPTLRSGDQVVSAAQARLLSLPPAQRAVVREQMAEEERARREAERQARAERLRAREAGARPAIGIDGSVRPPPAPAQVELRTEPQAASPPPAEPSTPEAPAAAPAETERRPVRIIGPLIAPRAAAPRPPSG